MSNSTPIPKTKQCSKCGEIYPATSEFYSPSDRYRSGFISYCRDCGRAMHARWREKNREHTREYSKKYWEENREECLRRMYQRREENREEYLQWRRDWYKQNGDKLRRKARKYARENRDARKRYEKSARKLKRIHLVRYRARKASLPDNFTTDDWQYALNYFHGCCAVCGRQLNGMFGEVKPNADHWIPITDESCPGTVPGNIVPLCGGVGGCNQRKADTPPEEWLEREYGKRKGQKILKRINEYFESLNSDN